MTHAARHLYLPPVEVAAILTKRVANLRAGKGIHQDREWSIEDAERSLADALIQRDSV